MLRTDVLLFLAGTLGYVHVGGSCTSETDRIHAADLIRDFKVNCIQKEVYSCEFDGSIDYDPGIKPYNDRCYELDGQIFWYNSSSECTDDVTGIENKSFWLKLPICLGKSCTVDDLRAIQEHEWKPNIIQDNLPGVCYISFENTLSLAETEIDESYAKIPIKHIINAAKTGAAASSAAESAATAVPVAVQFLLLCSAFQVLMIYQ